MIRHALGCLAATMFLTGCATLLDRDREPIRIDSDPQGAAVTMTCGATRTVQAETPAVLEVGRRDRDCVIVLAKTGYVSRQVALEHGLNRRILWNLLPLGAATVYLMNDDDIFEGGSVFFLGSAATAGGFLLDWMSGRNDDHDPKRIRVSLPPETSPSSR